MEMINSDFGIKRDGDGWFELWQKLKTARGGWIYMGRYQNRLLALSKAI